MRKGVFNLTRTGIEQGGGAQHRNQSPGGALVSPRVPTARNVYRGSSCFDLYGNLSYIIQDRLFSKNKIYLR